MTTKNRNKKSLSLASELPRSTNTSSLIQLSKKLKNNYLLTIFELTEKEETYLCKICPDKPTIRYKNLKRHILDCEDHERCVPNKDLEKHSQLVRVIKETKRVLRTSDTNEESLSQEASKCKKGYLKFTAACFKAKLSFQQIQKVGLALKEIYSDNDMSFLSRYGFSLDEISNTANCWGDYLKENIEKDLRHSHYSLCIDNSTISGTNISVLQLRYLKEVESEEHSFHAKQLRIQNRVIGLKYLGESVTGQTLYDIVKEKLFDINDEIKDNLVGFTHDHASSLSGEGVGLYGLLKEAFCEKTFFNIKDPCHGLTLSVYKSLELLEDVNIMKFIKKIHSHFISPQRRQYLSQIQRSENYSELSLRHYVETRWLSLGSSLRRLLQNWPSLVKYMEEPKILSVKKKDKEEFLEALNDESFKLKILFISRVIDKINSINTDFQKQNLEINQLPLLINKIIKEIAELFIKPSMLPKKLSGLSTLEWKSNNEFWRSDDNFLSTLSIELSDKTFVKILNADNDQINATLIKTFRDFLMNLLEKLLYYLPYKDETIQALSFLSLDDEKDDIKAKIFEFNKVYNVIPSDEEDIISDEINDLFSLQVVWMRKEANGSSLNFWNLIEQTYHIKDAKTKNAEHRFPCLSKIIRFAHAFAPSSANVEQCFSVLKLMKSELRNSLKEKTLESLILLHEEFKDDKPIQVPNRLIEIFDEMKRRLNEQKSASRFHKQVEIQKENELRSDHDNPEEFKTNHQSVSRIILEPHRIFLSQESQEMEIEKDKAGSERKNLLKRSHSEIPIIFENIQDDPQTKPLTKAMKLSQEAVDPK